MQKDKLTPEQEKEKVLSMFELKKTALQKKMKKEDLSEEDFVQLLNLATKTDLVENAANMTLKDLAAEHRKQLRDDEPVGANGAASAAVVGAAAAGVEGAATMYVASSAAGGLLTMAIGIPVAAGRWCWGKAKEIKRTFNASYQNDKSKNRLGKALWRSIKYPFFKIPLINKMRRDVNFMATPKERENFKNELKEKRIDAVKKEAKILAKYAGYPALAFGGVMATMFILPDLFEGGNFATGAPLIFDVAALGATLGVCAYPFGRALSAVSNIEPKYMRGRRLIEQVLNYSAAEHENAKTKTEESRDEVKAQLNSDKAKADIAEKKIGKVDEKENTFRRSRKENTRPKRDIEKATPTRKIADIRRQN